ncbi:methyltransferase-like protein [Thermochaetoides thermophila DSM 1495]|uniref:Arsenite methyltransferase n=1 Tax=Chaetomium thermophilum (strain DSM 1495 / CBS 144.50 / IMI 039719) TaxID=759272 RepID=G0SAC6_CHATD|nr:methyltransferase-like protein [Thermochaetoides thermophila DSM 1495]EGS19698.1 methyltransferase-like protein [Thermochaetoides thermophila DSM 1495]
MATENTTTIYEEVRKHYSAASRSVSTKYGEAVAKSFGYTAEELAAIPAEANLGLSCGNPLAIASVKEGETIIDLGSGAGFDVFLAAKRVGANGKAIGVDMNDDMLERARKILESQPEEVKKVVSFVKSNITDMSSVLEDGVADCVISNCVINLVPAAEKPKVFKEMYRVLKHGGRVAVSDILAKQDLPEQLVKDVAMYVGCIAGASKVEEYETWLKEAGFKDVLIIDTKSDLNVYVEIGEDGEKKRSTEAKNDLCCGQNLQNCALIPAASEESGGCCGANKAEPAFQKQGEGCCKMSAGVSSSAGCCGAPSSSSPAPSGCCGVPVPAGLAESLSKTDLNEYVGSFKIYALKG